MMAVTGTQIDTKARYMLQDETPVRWTQTETLAWINSGLNEILFLKPNALVTTTTMICVAGTKQSLPTGALLLLDITRNMGTNGTTPGATITKVERNILDALLPTWHTVTANAVTQYYMYDPRNPRTFYVYPAQPTSSFGYLELSYSTTPTPLSALANNIPLDDIYEMVLVDYVLYRAYSKDSEVAASQQMATAHYQAFTGALGARMNLEGILSKKEAQPTPQG